MKTKNIKSYCIKSAILAVISLMLIFLYLTFDVNAKYFDYVMSIRYPKIFTMIIASCCIGGATIIFQSIIKNVIFTPCLLGMNSLYLLIHTLVVFFLGSSHIIVRNQNFSFALDLIIMGIVATFVYSYLFKKTNNNMLYILLIGTVMSSLFSSAQSSLVRIMDPNEYETLLSSLVANFSNVNSEIMIFAILAILGVIIFLWHELKLLDIIILGKNQAISLGVNYDKAVSKLLLGVTLLISIATAMVGPVSFLGLILANLSREILKTYRHKFLIPVCIMIGVISLIGGQLIVEHVFVYSIPISVFITTGGGLYFLYLLLRKERVTL